jgi:chromosome segregation ATPase
VNEHYPTAIETENYRSTSLAESLDPAIGEATSVMGAMVTELMRRSLRGGVMQIGKELHAYVADRVDATIADRTPALERAAAEVAETAARTAATEVAVEEVKALEGRTRESQDQLAARIQKTAQEAERQTSETARDLAGKIEEAERKAQTVTQETARGLASQIEQSERRVSEATQALVNQQVQDLYQRSREGTNQLKARLATVEAAAAELTKQHDALRQELARAAEESQARLRAGIAELVRTNEALSARVAELEKPRGFKRLFSWGKRPAPAVEAPPA